MRILIVSTQDTRGGAARAAFRLGEQLREEGHEVLLYAKYKSSDIDWVQESPLPSFMKKVNQALDYGITILAGGRDAPFLAGVVGESLSKVIEEFNPDVINFHWLGKGFVNFKQVARISKKRKTFLTLHDCSTVLGGFIYSQEYMKHVPKGSQWIADRILDARRKHDNSITVISPSEYLANLAIGSEIFDDESVHAVNNGVDTNVFTSRNKEDKEKIYEKWNLDKNKKYILFGAVNLRENPVKGGDLLISTLSNMKEYLEKNDIGLISFGSQDVLNEELSGINCDKHHLGFIKDEKEIGDIYSIADVMLVPSRAENYPFVVMESLCCGTPVVSFDVGGIPEMLRHEANGYVAKHYDLDDFANGIQYVLENLKDVEPTKDWDVKNMTAQYIELFNK